MCARRNVAVVCAALLTVVVAVAADVFQEYGMNRQEWDDSLVSSITGDYLYAPMLPAKLKSLPPTLRAAVVTAMGTAAKAFVATPGFKAKYKAEYEAKLPDELKPPRTAKQIADQMRADAKKGLADIEEALKSFQGELRKEAEAGAAQMREEVTRQLKNVDEAAAAQAADEKTRYDEATSRPPDPDALSPDPNVALKRALKRFLDETAGVDFAALTKTQYGLKRFANDTYESKPRPWKMCYRAGREACDAARAFVTTWLGELK